MWEAKVYSNRRKEPVLWSYIVYDPSNIGEKAKLLENIKRKNECHGSLKT